MWPGVPRGRTLIRNNLRPPDRTLAERARDLARDAWSIPGPGVTAGLPRRTEEALGLAEELAHALDARLLLAQIIASPAALYPKGYTTQAFPALTAVQEAAQAYLERLADNIRERGVEVDVHVEAGEPTATLLEIAGDGSVDMIAMTTHGRSAVGRIVMGSVADAVSRAVEIPCLIVQACEWSDGRSARPTDGAGPSVQSSERVSKVVKVRQLVGRRSPLASSAG